MPLYEGEGAVKLIFSFFKIAKEEDNRGNVVELLSGGCRVEKKGSKIHFKSVLSNEKEGEWRSVPLQMGGG